MEAVPVATIDIFSEEPEQQGVGKIWYKATITSQTLTILFAIAAATLFANFVAGNPMALFATATASMIGQTAPPALTGDEIALFREAAHQAEVKLSKAKVQALTTRFQAWAAEVDAKAQVELPGQPATDHLRTAIVTTTKSAQIHGHNRPQHKARSAVRRTQHARRHKRQKQYARPLDWFAATRGSERPQTNFGRSTWSFKSEDREWAVPLGFGRRVSVREALKITIALQRVDIPALSA